VDGDSQLAFRAKGAHEHRSARADTIAIITLLEVIAVHVAALTWVSSDPCGDHEANRVQTSSIGGEQR